ncbi:MAG TPA: glycosyltransferase family 39 protein, partial [Tepidisphaeraceae bacterium]|nr:glycosyltransferase family 39 protein [Tepidisphaeraceae bacterium]
MSENPWANWFLLGVCALFAIASVVSGLISEGFLEADGCSHYIYARFAFDYPVYLVDTWGRPFKTAWYAPAATHFGLQGVRVWSCVTALIVAWISFRIAKRAGLNRPQLAAIFLLGQPLFFMHSFSELTELPFAMLLGGAFLAYQSKRWWICAVLTGLMPLARPEGFGFILIFFVLLITQKRWRELFLLPIPFIVWSIAGWWLFGKTGSAATWVFDHWPYSGESMYKPGPIWHFGYALFLKVLGPPIFLLMCVGVVAGLTNLFRNRSANQTGEIDPNTRAPFDLNYESAQLESKSDEPISFVEKLRRISFEHQTQTRALVVAFPLMILIGHSVLYALGKMASNGEPRYMLIVAPFWAVLGAMGFEFILHKDWRDVRKKRLSDFVLFSIASILAIAPTVTWQASYPTIPLVQMPDWLDTKTFASWYKSTDARERYPHLLASHPGVCYYLDMATIGPTILEWKKESIDAPKPG